MLLFWVKRNKTKQMQPQSRLCVTNDRGFEWHRERKKGRNINKCVCITTLKEIMGMKPYIYTKEFGNNE